MKLKAWRRLLRRQWARLIDIGDNDGMSTVEYAIGTVAAAAFAAVLYTVVTGSSVLSGLGSLVNKAMSVKL